MKTKKPKVLFIPLFQIRRLKLASKGWARICLIDLIDFNNDSEFVCNEISMDRAMAVADAEALAGKMCVILPFTAVTTNSKT